MRNRIVAIVDGEVRTMTVPPGADVVEFVGRGGTRRYLKRRSVSVAVAIYVDADATPATGDLLESAFDVARRLAQGMAVVREGEVR